MRKAYRTALFVGLVILAVPALAIAWIPMWIWYRTTQLDTFYRERPVLGAMRTRQSSSSNNSAAAREALLENLPLGTNKALVITDLSQIGFGCQAMTAGSAGAKLRKYAPPIARPRVHPTQSQVLSTASSWCLPCLAMSIGSSILSLTVAGN